MCYYVVCRYIMYIYLKVILVSYANVYKNAQIVRHFQNMLNYDCTVACSFMLGNSVTLNSDYTLISDRF